MGRIHPKHKIAFTLAFLVLLTALSLNITILYGDYDSFKDVRDLVGMGLGDFGVPSMGGSAAVAQSDAGLWQQGIFTQPFSQWTYEPSETILPSLKVGLEKNQGYYAFYMNGLLNEDDFNKIVFSTTISEEIFKNGAITSNGVPNIPLTLEHFFNYLKSNDGNINDYLLIILKSFNFNRGADVNEDDILQEKLNEYLNYYFPTAIMKSLSQTSTDLGFSDELKTFIAELNALPEEPADTTGSAFKNIWKWITGYVTYTNNCEKFLVNGASNQKVDLIWTDLNTKVTPICAGEYKLMAFNVLGGSNGEKVALICEPGATFIGGQAETAFKITGDNVIISGCTFKNFNIAISGEEKSNIEFFGNTFVDNDIAIQLNNWKATVDGDIKKPTAKIIGNTFENTDNLAAITSNLFNGEMIISNNNFKNGVVALVGDNKDQGATSISTITKNKFTRTSPELAPALVLFYIDEGIIYGNKFEKAKNKVGELMILSSSDIMVNNNLFTADESTTSISVSLNEVNDFTFTNNYIQGFAKSIIGIKLTNSLFQNNDFKDNNLVIQLDDSENGIFLDNNFVNNKGIPPPQQSQILSNMGILLTKFKKGIFYNNLFDTTKNNFIVLFQSPNNYLYDVNNDLVYIMPQTQGSGPGAPMVPVSSAYMYYSINIDVDRKYNDVEEPLDFAQVEIKDKDKKVIMQYPVGFFYNSFVYSFTKTSTTNADTKFPFTYSVSYGNDDEGEPIILKQGEGKILELKSAQQIAPISFEDDCISPPVDYNVEYKTYNPSDKKYTDSIPLLSIKVNPEKDGNEYTNILINKDTTFCGGLYEIYDGDFDVSDDKKGMIQFTDNTQSTTPLKIVCKDTQFKGKVLPNGKEGAGIYIKNNKNIEVEGCTFKDYNKGMLIDGSQDILINKNKFTSNDVGLQVNQEVAGQDLPSESQAIISLNTFENNKDWNLLFINPANDIDNPSYVFNNIFKNTNTNPAKHPPVKFDLLENDADTPLDSQIMLYKDGQGNYWEDYKEVVKIACVDNYINYKDSYIDADKGNDNFCDKAYQFKANGVAPQYDLLDKYPYSQIIDFSKIIPKTSATVTLNVDDSNNLVATTAGYEPFITGVSYNWVVDEESMTVLNLPMNKWDTTGAEIYKLKDISGNNLIAYAGDGTGKNAPELTDDGVGKGMKFSGDEFIKIPYLNNLNNKFKDLDEFDVEFIFKNDENKIGALVAKTSTNGGFVFEVNKGQPDGVVIGKIVLTTLTKDATIQGGFKQDILFEYNLDGTPSWHHVYLLFKKTSKEIDVYVDGEKANKDKISFEGKENLIFNNGDLFIGGFDGIIDEFKIYNKALSPEQIQTNYVQLFFEGKPKGAFGPSGLPSNKNTIKSSTHGDCGNWKVKSYLTTKEGFLITTDALGSSYNEFLCGLEVCTDDTKCIAPKKCLASDKIIDTKPVKVCDYPSCANDGGCGAGESCAFGKCLICKNAQEDMEITEPTIICAGTYNAVDTNNDGYIKITKDNVGLMCQDGVKIIGPETKYDMADTTISTGIFANNVDNIKIINCNISNFNNGIVIGQSEISEFTKNILHDNAGALYLSAVKNSKLLNNTITNNVVGLYFEGVKSVSVSNTHSTDNQFNALMSGKNIVFNTSNLTNSKHIVDINQAPLKDISNKEIIIGIISTEIPIFKFYNTYYDDAYFYTSEYLTDADKLSANVNIKRYWTLTANVVKSTDGMSPVEGASIETMSSKIEGVGMVDVNEDNVIDNKDVSFTDKDGMATTYLLANITDKAQTSTTKDLNPYTITAFKSTGLPGAKPAVSAPFTIKEPTFKKLDLDTGKEFEIPKVYESTTTQSSSTGGGGSSYEKTCSPQVDDKCKLKYKYTPCVLQGNLSYPTKIFTCNSTNNCGMRLFVEPCEGNAPSYAQGCSNKIKDLFEDGVDCGGPCSKQCAATCTDKKQNQGETDVDCGGSASGSNACAKCLDDRKCSGNEDCKSGFCKNGWCKQSTCYDSFKNQDETNVDCGGKICAPCEGKQEATCYDNIINQGETDVDCGGPCKSCTPILEQPTSFNYYWLLLLLLIPLIAILFYVGYSQYQKQHKFIPPMSKGFGKGNGLKELKGNKGLPLLNDLKLPKELEAELEKPSKFSNKPMPLKKEMFTEFDNVIKDEIKKLLDEGKSKHEINEALKAKGYPHEKVNYLFENSLHDLLPKTYEEQIKKYINYYLSRGMSKTAIKEALLEKGWNKKIVDGVFGNG